MKKFNTISLFTSIYLILSGVYQVINYNYLIACINTFLGVVIIFFVVSDFMFNNENIDNPFSTTYYVKYLCDGKEEVTFIAIYNMMENIEEKLKLFIEWNIGKSITIIHWEKSEIQ